MKKIIVGLFISLAIFASNANAQLKDTIKDNLTNLIVNDWLASSLDPRLSVFGELELVEGSFKISGTRSTKVSNKIAGNIFNGQAFILFDLKDSKGFIHPAYVHYSAKTFADVKGKEYKKLINGGLMNGTYDDDSKMLFAVSESMTSQYIYGFQKAESKSTDETFYIVFNNKKQTELNKEQTTKANTGEFDFSESQFNK